MDDEIVTLDSASGMLEAEILRGLLETIGVRVWLAHEAASTAYGITMAPMGNVDIMVLKKDMEQARELLDDYRAGRLAEDDSEDSGS
jgi:hypothetical protein